MVKESEVLKNPETVDICETAFAHYRVIRSSHEKANSLQEIGDAEYFVIKVD